MATSDVCLAQHLLFVFRRTLYLRTGAMLGWIHLVLYKAFIWR